MFSGGQPHTAMCVGDGINLCAYESDPLGLVGRGLDLRGGLDEDHDRYVHFKANLRGSVRVWMRIC